MTASKLWQILCYLSDEMSLRAVIVGVSAGSEIQLELSGQPERSTHEYLISKGFITNDNSTYIYRPR